MPSLERHELSQWYKDSKFGIFIHGGAYSVHQQAWPVWDPVLAAEKTETLIVQVDGRVRDRITVVTGTPDQEVQTLAQKSRKVAAHLEGRRVVRVILVPGRVVNIVTQRAG